MGERCQALAVFIKQVAGRRIIILSSRMFYVIAEKEQAVDPEQSRHSSLQLLNEDLFSQAIKVKQRIRNHSAANSHTTPKRDQQSTKEVRLATAHTAHHSTLPHEFTHPWSLTPKNRTIRIKTEPERRNSLRAMSERDREAGEKVFGRITIHCLRARRESLEHQSAVLDSHYNYTSRKLEHLQWQRRKEQQQAKRLRQLRQESREESEIITHISHHLSDEERNGKEKLRQRVLSQRASKQRVLDGVQKEKARVAYQQRLSSYQLKCEKKELDSYEIYEKRLMCQKEKQAKTQKQRIRHQCLEAKRQQARAGFRNKWMQQFQLASRASRSLTEKQHIFASKMQKAIQTFAHLS